MDIFMGIILPFIGTSLGALMVYFMKNNIDKRLEKILLGFASGVMIAASIWSLIIPSIERTESMNIFSWFPASLGLLLGILSLILIDELVNRINKRAEKIKDDKRKSRMLFLAVTLHNIPEGMAVGTVFAALLANTSGITYASAMALSLGIAIQNFPEGAIISMPLKSDGYSKNKSFLMGVLSGIVEPIFAVITILLANVIVPILPYLLSFAAGAMLYVVIHELIPDCQKEDNNLGPFGFTLGFLIMMILDVALS